LSYTPEREQWRRSPAGASWNHHQKRAETERGNEPARAGAGDGAVESVESEGRPQTDTGRPARFRQHRAGRRFRGFASPRRKRPIVLRTAGRQKSLRGDRPNFDWADLERRLGEAEKQLEDRDFATLGSALQSIIEWIIQEADFTKLDADAHVGRRAIALFWTLNPDYFEGVFLTTLANRLGLHKAILSAQAAEARRKFGIKNRAQAHGWNFGKDEPKSPETRKGGALAEAAMSQLKARLFRSSQTKQANGE